MSQSARLARSIRKHGGSAIKGNKSAILTALGITGFIGAIITTAIRSEDAIEALDELDAEIAYDCEHEHIEPPSKLEKTWMQTKKLAPIYAPTIILATFSTACIIGSYRNSRKDILSLSAAYELSEKARRDYMARVKEKIGEKEESKIRDSYYEQLSKESMPESSDDRTIIQTGEGDKLFYDEGTGRFFRASTRWLDHCRNAISHEVFAHDYASANEFADIIGLPCTTYGNCLGFNSNDLDSYTHLLDISWNRCYMSDWGEPYAVLEYTVHERYQYLD